LTSSVGSVIAASGSLDFPNVDKPYHVRAVNSHLVLSSSAGSVAVSGTLKVTQTASIGDMNASGDITAVGGMRRAYQFYFANIAAGQMAQMTSSQLTGAGGFINNLTIPMFSPSGGTVLGYSILPVNGTAVVAGAITASVNLGGGKVLDTDWTGGGSLGGYSNKDGATLTFSSLTTLGACITASADYKDDYSATVSGSWIMEIVVES